VSELRDSEVLYFVIRKKGFALPLSGIVEIILYQKPEVVPQFHDPFKGVIDLRGKVIPVIDFGAVLEVDEAAPPSEHILIVRFKKTVMGLMVDQVKGVLYLSEDQLQAASFVDKARSKYLKGIFKNREDLIMLLDLNQLMDLEGYQMLNQLVKG